MSNKNTQILSSLILVVLLVVGLSVLKYQRPPEFQSGKASLLSWRYDFNQANLDINFWKIDDGQSPGFIVNNHVGYSQADRVKLENGYLKITLTQEIGLVGTNTNGVISRGGSIHSLQTYGYGTYEWRARMSSTASSPTSVGSATSGSVTGLFHYINNSQTELGFEVEGQYPYNLYSYNWYNTDPTKDPVFPDQRTLTRTVISGMENGFKTYKLIWSQGKIEFYVDGSLVATHTTNVPQAAANFYINHYGMNTTDTGGLATIGVTRYVYVDWVRYTAPGEVPISDPAIVLDTTAPSVTITSPLAGETIRKPNVNITANASDNVGVAKVEFYVDGILLTTDPSSPYSTNWQSRKAARGQHTIKAQAYDAAGNMTSHQITIIK